MRTEAPVDYSQYEQAAEGTNVVIDTTWGDGGKGKLVDLLAQRADIVARYAGGDNAGHTVVNEQGEFKFHLMPSGIFNPETINVLADGVVVNPITLAREIQALQEAGVDVSEENLLISERAHLIMPWHRMRDGLEEEARKARQSKKGEEVGTTKKGIGPTYSDRTARVGLRAGDLMAPDFDKKLEEELDWQERLIRVLDGEQLLHQLADPRYATMTGPKIRALAQDALLRGKLDKSQIMQAMYDVREVIGPMITNTIKVIRGAHDEGRNVLGEGAQGALLDIDQGNYPFVTSSNPGVVGFTRATAISPREIRNVYGVTKAYATRVGGGPMPTEDFGETGKHLQTVGKEIGTTTGRTRRCGWLDAVAVRWGSIVGGATSLAITKLDILDGLPEVKICSGYIIDHVYYHDIAGMDVRELARATPVYETMKGWRQDTSSITEFSKLPANAQAYLQRIEDLVELPISFVSVGPHRDQTMLR